MKYLILVFSLICSIGYGQGIAPSQFEGSPYSGGYLKAVVKIWDDAILDSVYVYQHSPSEFSRIDSMTFSNDTLSVFTTDSIFQVEIISGGGSGNVKGNGATNTVAYWISSDSLTNESTFSYLPVNDRLGIGINVPTGLGAGLHLNGGTFTDLHLTNPTTGTASSDGTSLFINSTDAYLTNRENGDIVLATQNIERIRIDEDGILADDLKSGVTAPTTSGTLVKLVSDANGRISFQANNTGTVTSVGLLTGTSGTDINVTGSPVTGSGSFTLNIPTASGSNTGKLSSTDWTTFNSKIGGSGTADKVPFFTSSNVLSSDNLFHWNNTAKVLGIGTASPSTGARLHVADGDMFIIGGSNRRFLMGSSVSSGFWGGMQWNTSNQLTINHSGFIAGSNVVGIMTSDGFTGLRTLGTAPITPLDVFSSSTSDNGTYQNWAYNASPTLYRLLLKQTVTGGNVRYNFSQVNAGTAYDNALVFDRGNICLGCTDANRKLQVSGEVRITDLITDNPAWIVGADNDGDLNRIQVSTGLLLSGNTLSVNGVGTVTQVNTSNGITGGPIITSGTVQLTGQASQLHNLTTNGLITRTSSGIAARTITAGDGIAITNGDGVSGNPTIAVKKEWGHMFNSGTTNLTTAYVKMSLSATGADEGDGADIQTDAVNNEIDILTTGGYHIELHANCKSNTSGQTVTFDVLSQTGTSMSCETKHYYGSTTEYSHNNMIWRRNITSGTSLGLYAKTSSGTPNINDCTCRILVKRIK